MDYKKIGKVLQVTPVLAVAGGYSSGDQVGVPIEVPNFMLSSGGQGTLESLTVIDKSATTGIAMDVWFFKSAPTTVIDNDVFGMNDNQLPLVLGHVKVAAGDYSAEALGCLGCVRNIKLLLESEAGSNSIYVAIVTRGTPTYADGDIILKFGVTQH